MASTESLATWNPAFRPDSDLAPTAEFPTDSAAPPPPLDEPLDEAPPSEPSFEVLADGDLDTTQTTDPWPSQDTGESNDWLEEASFPNDEAVAETQPVVPGELEMRETSTDTPEPTSGLAATESNDAFVTSAPTAAGLYWTGGDGDEGADWLLDDPKPAEPSQHVTSADETNTSSPGPLLDQASESSDHPLPRTQAQDLMEEKPNEEETIFGGSTDNMDPDAMRYEEGLPLMGGTPDQVESPVDPSTTSRANDAFADDEDDFFSHIQESGKATADSDSQPRSLNRKSTVQAMGDTSAATNGQGSPFAGTSEGEEAAFFKSSEAHAGETGEQQAPSAARPSENTKTEDPDAIAAKWSEAFADDGLDEDFLDESPAQSAEPKEMDPAAFFGSDDEGFLDDDGFLNDQEQPASVIPPTAPTVASPGAAPITTSTPTSAQSRYAPVTALSQSAAPNAYMAPTQATAYQPSPITQTPLGYSAGVAPLTTAYGAPQPRPSMSKARSFADKSKGGYSSPYDLPMDLVEAPKPRKRASMQQLPKASATGAVAQPPRSASMFAPGPPPSASPPAGAIGSSVPPTVPHQPPHAPKPKESFFEDLPIATKPRPTSRHSHTASPGPFAYPSAPPPAHASIGHPQMPTAPTSVPSVTSAPMHAPIPPSSQTAPLAYGGAPVQTPPQYAQPPVQQMTHQTSGIANLVKPDVVNPYAPAPGQSHSAPPVAAPGNRYSPAPSQAGPPNGVPSHGASNRYSPAPSLSRQASFNNAPAPSSTAPAPILPHQPRTSSPLAHFEMTPDRPKHASNVGPTEPTYGDRRTSLPHEPRITRVPSLPPTHEVDEEEDEAMKPPQSRHSTGAPGLAPAPAFTSSKYSPSPAAGPRATPPPPMHSGEATLSPPKRSHYAPLSAQATAPKDGGFAPPARSFSQSPTSRRTDINGVYPHEPIRRPSSVHSPSSPKVAQPVTPAYKPSHRARAPSLTLNMIPPTDGRENDPLQRWKGAPIVAWGMGGTFVSTFPKSVPRYGMNQAAPMMVRNPGEVKVQHVKDILPPEDTLAKFPGPLKGKSKKKETVAWLNGGIDAMAKNIPDLTYTHHPSLEEMRSVERLLLWKILRVFIEHDGVLEGSPAIQKEVRSILVPGLDDETAQDASSAVPPMVAAIQHQGTTTMRADAVDSAGMELIRKHLMLGDREKAAWAAVDKRLWGHAMLIANTVSPDLYKQVAQEFVRKEVNYPGHNNESTAALYRVLSGNHEECVDELVPVHARAGLQLMTTNSAQGPTKDALEGLDKWRETLTLILGNRCPDDVRALTSLGELLSSYGRAEAAHICFIFARHHCIFGGADDPRSNFVLVGSDHRRQADQFFKDAEGLLLSEVYEYGLSLAGGAVSVAPHLSGYKLQLAATLAEYGHRDRALQYCEGVLAAIGAQTKRSPYHHAHLEQAAEDFVKRLKQAPREESHSWIPKPSMNKVSDTMWSKFNKFVAGDESDGTKNGIHGEEGVESGPFANIAGGTPTISRSPSVTNLDMQGGTNHLGYPLPHAPPALLAQALSSSAPAASGSRTASRYAPAPQQQSTPAVNPYQPSAYTPRSSSEHNRNPNPYEPSRPLTGHQQQYNPGMLSQPVSQPPQPAQSAPPAAGQEASYPMPAQGYAPSYQAGVPAPAPTGYTPFGMQEAASAPNLLEQVSPTTAPAGNQFDQGYQAPSYGYTPPAMRPADEPANEAKESESAEQPEASGGYEPPSYQAYGYEPPSYEPDSAGENDDESSPKPKKKSFMDDDEDDIPALKAGSGEKTKAEKDRENEEMVRRVAEEEEKRAAEKKAGKKGWGFGGWFGGGKKDASLEQANKPIKANLGEQSSFVYDPELKRWINKKAGADAPEAKKATPPPPKGPPRSANSTPPPAVAPGTPPPSGPPRTATAPSGPPGAGAPPTSDGLGAPSPMMRSVSNQSVGGPPSGPPSRPATSMSNASSIDDLLSSVGPRKPGQKKARKAGRYVDVMAK